LPQKPKAPKPPRFQAAIFGLGCVCVCGCCGFRIVGLNFHMLAQCRRDGRYALGLGGFGLCRLGYRPGVRAMLPGIFCIISI
jgi:hypothetical protein